MRQIELTKRQKIVIATIVVTILWMLSSNTSILILFGYKIIVLLGVATYLLSLWALWEGMSKLKAVILMILPVFFAVSTPLFYIVGRSAWEIRWLTRLPAAFIFGVSFYFLMLSQNIFNVAASSRTIPLYRAASTANFIFAFITSFFLFSVVFSLHLPFYLNLGLVALVCLPLIMQALWSIDVSKITPAIWIYSLILSLIVGEIGMSFSFWRIAPTLWSLSLATAIYVLVGIVTEIFRDKISAVFLRINRRVMWEYLGIGAAVFLFTLIITSWGS